MSPPDSHAHHHHGPRNYDRAFAIGVTLNLAFVIVEAEVDADFDLPAGAGAGLGIATDEMSYLRNSGSSTILDTHIQGTKVVSPTPNPGAFIPAGGSIPYTVSIRMGRGSGGATYNRVQSFVRAFVIVL